jgi:hypothetical protein
MKSNQVEIYVRLQYEATRQLGEDDEEFVLEVKGGIYGYAADDCANEKDVKLGDLKLYLVQVGNAYNEGVSRHDIFDMYQQTMDAGCALFDASFEEFSPWIQRRFDDAFPWEDILLLDRLTLNPMMRGQRLGLAVLYRAIRDWSSGCSLVVMKPYPLQYEAVSRRKEDETELKLDAFRTSKTESFRRLRAYYAQLGFERIGRSEFYVLCTKERTPSLKELSIPDCFTVSAEFIKNCAAISKPAKI